MPQTPQGYRRRNSLRYEGYDYTTPNAYSITICAYHGQCIFGQVIDHEMVLNPLGEIADRCCVEFGTRHARIELNAYVIMPNHVHILFTILEWLVQGATDSEQERVAKQRKFGDAIAGSVSTYMGGYKGAVTQKAKNQGLIPGPPLWQGKFYDHIVRGDTDFERQYSYIQSNPARWLADQLHPDAPPNKFNREWRK